jgi:hypothetical protein
VEGAGVVESIGKGRRGKEPISCCLKSGRSKRDRLQGSVPEHPVGWLCSIEEQTPNHPKTLTVAASFELSDLIIAELYTPSPVAIN